MTPATASRCAAAILVYHTIADAERDPFGITVAPADFDGQMGVLARRFNVLSLEQLGAGLQRGRLPDRAVVVTFDDGYANNLTAALPSLTAHGVPASLFVATGYIDQGREFWWDEIERLTADNADGDRAPVLELEVSGSSLRADMSDGIAAAREISLWLQGRPAGGVEDGLEQLRRWAGNSAGQPPRETHRPMTLEELRELAGSGQFEIGAHTRHHFRLGAQTEDVQRDEIAGSRDDLKAWLGAAPTVFAYPFGNPSGDYTPGTVAVVEQLGFELALSGWPGLTERSTSRYELPRWFVTTREPTEFERWLSNRFRPLPLRAVSKLAARARRRTR